MWPYWENLVRTAGALHFCQIPAMFLLGKPILGLHQELQRLKPITSAILKVVAGAVVVLLVSLGACVVLFPSDLLHSSLGRALALLLGTFWLTRALLQIYYGNWWPRTRAARACHWFLLLLFPLQGFIYLAASLTSAWTQ